MNRNKCTNRVLAYVSFINSIQEIGKIFGYNILINGSLATDFDLVAVPWIEEAKPAEELVEAIRAFVGGRLVGGVGIKPHGRRAWSIYDDQNKYGGDEPYIDLSILPRKEDSIQEKQ